MAMHDFYLGNPNSGGVFVADLKSDDFAVGVSMYLFEPFKDDENRALFSVVDDPGVCEMISKKEVWEKNVKPVCESDANPPKKIKSINTITKGEAVRLPNGNWKVVKEKKAKVEYIGTDVQEPPKILRPGDVSAKRVDEKEPVDEAREDAERSDKLELEAAAADGYSDGLEENIDDDEESYAELATVDVAEERESAEPFTEDVEDRDVWIEDEEQYSDEDSQDELGAVLIEHKPMSAIAKIFTQKRLCPYCFSAYTISRAEYKKKDARFICPRCDTRELPYTHRYGKSKDLYFAVLGAENAGKSHYLAVLIDVVKRRLTEAFKVNLQSLDDYTWDTYAEEYYNPIFKANKAARVNVDAEMPLLYSLSFMKPALFGKEQPAAVSTLAFFDVDIAGETLEAGERRQKDNYVNGIILLIDPLQLPKVREMLKLPAISGKPAEETVNNVAKLIREEAPKRYGDPNKKIDIPIAIALSKIDILKDKLGEDKQFLFCGGKHDGCFDQADAENVGGAIELLIGDLAITVTRHFSDSKFFGISALGSAPIGSDIPKLEPIRVEDPFLWLLYKRGVIKGKKV